MIPDGVEKPCKAYYCDEETRNCSTSVFEYHLWLCGGFKNMFIPKGVQGIQLQRTSMRTQDGVSLHDGPICRCEAVELLAVSALVSVATLSYRFQVHRLVGSQGHNM